MSNIRFRVRVVVTIHPLVPMPVAPVELRVVDGRWRRDTMGLAVCLIMQSLSIARR